MRLLLVLAGFLSLESCVLAQGTFNGTTAVVQIGSAGKIYTFSGGFFDSDRNYHPAQRIAAGSTIWGQWYVGVGGETNPERLSPVGSPKQFVNGYIYSGSLVTMYPAETTITVQLRVTDMTIEGTGESALYQVGPLAEGLSQPPVVAGFKGFDMAFPIPEPTTYALAVFGLATLLIRKRRK